MKFLSYLIIILALIDICGMTIKAPRIFKLLKSSEHVPVHKVCNLIFIYISNWIVMIYALNVLKIL